MVQSKLYNQDGKETGTITVPERVFNVPRNNDLLHQVITAMQANARQGSANTKDRSEVSGGGKKPWRQKGTGRARHGSIRSPLWRGGGITFGPRTERIYERKINKKMRAQALAVVLSEKMRHGEIIFLDALALSPAKTKNAKAILARLAAIPDARAIAEKKKNAVLLSLSKDDSAVRRGFQNFGNVAVVDTMNLNPLSLLQYKYVILTEPEVSVPMLEKRIQK
ncbi:MAG: 50S ribosomal protein L4 [Parcubacteria group bacterium]|nr:50S ribosomal protein L4 [Parcubacteria group bacterium]